MKIAVIGSGLMARAIVYDFLHYQDLNEIVVLEKDSAVLETMRQMLVQFPSVKYHQGDVADESWLRKSIEGCRVIVSAAPYRLNRYLLQAALNERAHFVDLGGNMEVVRQQFELDGRAKAAGIAAIPACGVAPGTLSLLAMRGIERLDRVETIRLYCGGLPQKPEPPLGYQFVFSVEGLINEYVEPVEVIEDGEVRVVPPLEGLEPFTFGRRLPPMEVFYTSGNTGTLVWTLKGRVRNLSYRTIRYAGHRDRMKLLFDLGFGSSVPIGVGETPDGSDSSGLTTLTPRKILEKLLSEKLPREGPDLVIGKAAVEGRKGRRKSSVEYSFIDRADPKSGLSAMARCTGFGAAIVAGMLARGEIAGKGVMALEESVPPGKYIEALEVRGIAIREDQQAG